MLEEEDSLRHLVHQGKAANGTTQGDPEAGGHFCVGWKPEVVELDTTLSAVGGAGMTLQLVVLPRWYFLPLRSSGESLRGSVG